MLNSSAKLEQSSVTLGNSLTWLTIWPYSRIYKIRGLPSEGFTSKLQVQREKMVLERV